MNIDWALAGKITWCAFIVAWVVIRWIPNRRARKVRISYTSRTPLERFSMAMSSTGLGIVPAIWVFTGQPSAFDRAAGPISFLIAIVLLAASLRMFRLTHKALGAMWSHSLDLREEHKLVTRGVYEKLRHPMYTAFWLWAAAQPFLLANWVAGLAGIIGFGTLYFLRIGQEERMLEERFGQEWRDYVARTKRILPGLY
jgi:protein-S-isoprenylcysteine O-methyltransferase Ste14